jgi:hypothetical protein
MSFSIIVEINNGQTIYQTRRHWYLIDWVQKSKCELHSHSSMTRRMRAFLAISFFAAILVCPVISDGCSDLGDDLACSAW